MKYKTVFSIIGTLLFFLGLSMLLPLACDIFYQENVTGAFVASIIITIATGLSLRWCFPSKEEIGSKEAFAIAAFGWTLVVCFGTLPFLFAGTFPSFIDAFFETMSGFTTTGASVLADIERHSHAILFWRNQIQWLGGMGIVVLLVAIIPALRLGGVRLFKAETPGPTPSKLTGTIKDTAKLLWLIYVVISAAEVICLYVSGMSLFDAFTHMFGTMPTGGFTPRNLSVSAFNNPLFEIIIIVFMFIAGINFILIYGLFRREIKSFLKDREFLFYVGVILLCVLITTVELRLYIYQSIFTALRYASFQVVSITTTTGFVTANYDVWPPLSKIILLVLMFVGGCAGSTGGAIKCMRVFLLLKQAYRELHKLVHPQAVIPIRWGDKVISEDVLRNITAFFFLYVLTFIICSFIMTGLGLDMISAISSVAATLGNVGPGFGLVGPTQNYFSIPAAGKIVLIFCMLLGRLEIYTVLILLIPAFWKK